MAIGTAVALEKRLLEGAAAAAVAWRCVVGQGRPRLHAEIIHETGAASTRSTIPYIAIARGYLVLRFHSIR